MIDSLDEIINTYNSVLKVVDNDAKEQDGRAYGGYIRATKGKLQEYITEALVKLAWHELGYDDTRLMIDSKKVPIHIKPSYLNRIENQDVKNYIQSHIQDYVYKLSVDKHVYIDDKFVMAIECKAYTENAMVKRILVDFDLLLTVYPNLSCYLFQLESQLGGDYSDLSKPLRYGSHSTVALQSYFDVNLKIITLLDGERNIDNPIHKHFKPLSKPPLTDTLNILKDDLRKFG